jgi:hypothetical protein
MMLVKKMEYGKSSEEARWKKCVQVVPGNDVNAAAKLLASLALRLRLLPLAQMLVDGHVTILTLTEYACQWFAD